MVRKEAGEVCRGFWVVEIQGLYFGCGSWRDMCGCLCEGVSIAMYQYYMS